MHRGLTPVITLSAPGQHAVLAIRSPLNPKPDNQHLIVQQLRRIEAENIQLKKELEHQKRQISILCRQNEKLLNLPEGFALKNFLEHQNQKTQREKTIELILQLHKSGLAVTQIANHLEKKHIKTLSGRGQWHRGTINNILKRYL